MSLNVTHKPSLAKEEALNRQDHLDEVQGHKEVEAQKVHEHVERRLDREQQMRVGVNGAPSSTARDTDQSRLNNLYAIQETNKSLAEGVLDRSDIRDRLAEVAIREYDPRAQEKFLAYLDSKDASPDELAWVAAKIKGSLPPGQLDVGPMREYFNNRGIRLLTRDKLPDAVHSLDRKSFIALLENRTEPVDASFRRRIFGQIRGLAGKREVFNAHWYVKRRVIEGKLQFRNDHKRDEFIEGLEKIVAEKTGGGVNQKEIAYRVGHWAKDGYPEEGFREVINLLIRASSDPDTMFYARRVSNRVVGRAIRSAEEKHPDKLPQLRDARDQLNLFFDAALDGRFDRFGMRKSVLALYKAGRITRAEASGYLVASSVSRTHDEFIYASMLTQVRLQILQHMTDMLEEWNDMWEDWARSLTHETDSFGNIIRTADEIAFEKILLQRQLTELRVCAERHEALAMRAFLKGRETRIESNIASAATPSEVESLEGAQAAFASAVQSEAVPPAQ